MKQKGQVAFLCATAVALLAYWLTVPKGLPWNESTRLALAYLGECTRLPVMPHPIWGFYVKVFGGPIALSVSLVALAAGLIAALVNRYMGWRFAASAALVWIFLPGVWNRAITGERGVCLAAMVVVAVWVVQAIAFRVTQKARATRAASSAGAAGGDGLGGPIAHAEEKKRGKVSRIAGWVVLGAAGLFAVVAVSTHDSLFGEAASAYARLVVEEAGGRVIVLNGVCDEQVEREVKLKARERDRPTSSDTDEKGNRHSSPSTQEFSCLSLRNTDDNRSSIAAWVKREWPSETNLWLEAAISPAAFAEAVAKAHPERFHSMMGHTTTPEKWEARWEAMKPYLKSRDPFVPAMRRMFAYEGNLLANAMTEKKRAWNLYYRIFTEIHPKNPAACVNLNVMLRRGYKVDETTRQRIESQQAEYVKVMADRRKAKRVAEWISHFGPVMRDQKVYEELRERVRKQMEELEKAGDKTARIPDLKTLEEWHPEMMKAFCAREYEKSARIARAILARKAWRGFVPAHMVMGEAMLMKGDWVAAEIFLRVAVEATGAAAPPPFVLNDYAETLRQLGRLDEAEKYARRAVKESDEKNGWVFRLTLAEVLEAKKVKGSGEEEEIVALLGAILKQAPKEAREKIRKEHKGYLR